MAIKDQLGPDPSKRQMKHHRQLPRHAVEVVAVTGNVRHELKTVSNNTVKKAKKWYIGEYSNEWAGVPGDLLKLRLEKDTTPTKPGQPSWRESMLKQHYTPALIYELGNLAAAITVPDHVHASKTLTEPEKDQKMVEQFEQWRHDIGDNAETLIGMITDKLNTAADEKCRLISETESLSGLHIQEADEWNLVDTIHSGTIVVTGEEMEMPSHVQEMYYDIDNYDDDDWTDVGFNGDCIMGHQMKLFTTADLQLTTGSNRFQCKMCMDHINPAIDGDQFLMICFEGNCKGKYTMCKSCAGVNNQEQRMHTVQGILQTHAQAVNLRDTDNPTLAANAMLTMEQVANLAMVHDEEETPTKSREVAGAIPRPSVTDGSRSASSQSVAMITDFSNL